MNNKLELETTPVLEEKLLAPSPEPAPSGMDSEEVETSRSGVGRWLQLLRRGSLALIALVIVVLATAWFNIPRRAIAWRIEREVAKQGFNLSLREVSGLRPWGQAKLEGIVWTLPGSTPNAPPDPVEFDSVQVNASLWKYLRQRNLDVDVLAELPQGQIQADVQQDKGFTVIKGRAVQVPLQWVPKLQATLGTSVEGLADLVYDLRIPKKDVDQISGTLEIRCSECAIGDGVSRVKFPGATGMAAGGITLPRIHLGALDALIVFGDGKARVERFNSTGDDMKLLAQGQIELGKPIFNFRPDIELKVFFEPKLLERADTFDLMVKSAVTARLDGPDKGWLGYRWIYYPPKRRSVFLGVNSKTLKRLMKTMGNKSPLAANRKNMAPAGILKPSRPPKVNRPSRPPPPTPSPSPGMKGVRPPTPPPKNIANRSAQIESERRRREQDRAKAERMIQEVDERARRQTEERAEKARKEAEEKAQRDRRDAERDREREEREEREGRDRRIPEVISADAAAADPKKMKRVGRDDRAAELPRDGENQGESTQKKEAEKQQRPPEEED